MGGALEAPESGRGASYQTSLQFAATVDDHNFLGLRMPTAVLRQLEFERRQACNACGHVVTEGCDFTLDQVPFTAKLVDRALAFGDPTFQGVALLLYAGAAQVDAVEAVLGLLDLAQDPSQLAAQATVSFEGPAIVGGADDLARGPFEVRARNGAGGDRLLKLSAAMRQIGELVT